MIRNLISPAILASFLAACGGGGGDSSGASNPPPTQAQPPVISAQPPSTGSGVDLTSTRVKIMAATQAAVSGSATVALPVTSAGVIYLNPFEQYWSFFPTPEGKIFGLSRPGETLLVDPSTVKMVCHFAGRVGWGVNGGTSRACAPLTTSGTSTVPNFATLPRTCNNDAGQYAAVLKGTLKTGKTGTDWQDWEDGEVLWADFGSERKFTFDQNPAAPMVAQLMTSGPNKDLIEYGLAGVGYKQAKLEWKSGKLVADMGSNCHGGFGLDNKLTDINPALPNTYYRYFWNGKFAGADGKDGWGSVEVTNPDGTVRKPSVKIAYAVPDTVTGNQTIAFEGLKCGDAGNITVQKGTGDATAPVWEDGIDAKGLVGFGIGWLVIQKVTDLIQFWDAKAPLVLDRDIYQIKLPACTAS